MTTRGASTGSWWLGSIQWLVLGGWVGSWGLFAFVVAPTAFRVLPDVASAGDLVGPVLRSLHLYGLFAGLGLAAIARTEGRSLPVWVAPLVLAGLCAFSEFVISSAIDGVRPRDLGPDSAEDAAATFARLHATSRAIFGVVLLGAVGLVFALARPARARSDAGPEPDVDPRDAA